MAFSGGIRSREEAENIVRSYISVDEVYDTLKVDELKEYLRHRDLNLSGNKKSLSVKVFGASKL